MTAPEASWSLSERLDWLLATVPCAPGKTQRLSADDLVTVLARVAPGTRAPGEATRMARRWIAELRHAGARIGNDWASERFMAALEDIFRLPLGYFRDTDVAAAADARIAFAAEAQAAGLRIVGPCRTTDWEMSVEQLHSLHVQAMTAIRRRSAS
jgi:hypothetical protein